MKRVRGRFILMSLLFSTIAVASLVAAWYLLFYVKNSTTQTQYQFNSVFAAPPQMVFEPVLPGQKVRLPNDFRFHSQYQHEWWHYFASLQDAKGTSYSVQWSFFRLAGDERDVNGWQNPQIYLANVVVSGEGKVWKDQRIARGGIGQAGSSDKPFRMWIDNWTWRALGVTPFPGNLIAASDEFSLELATRTSGPFVLNGESGYQLKHDLESVASFSVSAPFLQTDGVLHLDGKSIKVSGSAWLQKEWGSDLVGQDQQGWDWLVFNLDNGMALSVNQYRHKSRLPYVFGTLSTSSGKVFPLKEQDIKIIPLEESELADGTRLPLRWSVEVPQYQIRLTATAVDQEMWLPFLLPYWEGPIQVAGSHQGWGFMQLTGYGETN
ncbi:carotenoid 1,2-hydratase [Vibrio navarrensis]|uniref:Carotenoid 1,2-hydratase n=1 Tax=Vibrio navarrensis TaxID=29495 RepID=A0AAJ4I907_9VIBR|nr:MULTISPECIES: lipocalin-like domain-containing protein [Vibrio]KJR21604.1 ABC transporter [Vibrio sp. S234-5]MBE3652206.1 carotenoid 1,2-hydratase [Vibrio navarrensis]MBE3656686.1 carotenoid 1,2-hydratase [Vibrio navarrensis]MBE3661720.1 carotenoid 1,2-hydratase [Vibrio navarrensis]MBE4603104.1 carotenoid 1,2-hydratase [Vibrio navarrensis]